MMDEARKRSIGWRRASGIGVLGLLAVAGVATGTAAAERGRSSSAGIEAVRAATERYLDERVAVAEGFIPTDVCVPGMGYHYVRPERLDGSIRTSEPEVLVYVPTPDGGRRLGAAEWLAFDADQDLATDDDRPAVYGHPFDGPMEGHEPGMPRHYDLHAWAWLENPDGAFSPLNPLVSCPGGGSGH